MKTKRISTAAGVAALVALSMMSPTPTATPATPPGPSYDAQDWPMYNRDVLGSRYNSAETTLSPANVDTLVEKWRIDVGAAVHATPIVVDGTVYVGDGTVVDAFAGVFRAIDAETGDELWATDGFVPITASALVVGDMVIFGDVSGMVHGLNRFTGVEVWSMTADETDETGLTAIFGSPVPVGDTVVIGVSTIEDDAAPPGTPCCSTRGSVLAFDPETGAKQWQFFTISDAQKAAGSSGATVWSTPTYDPETGIVYATTGQNFTAPATELSDSIIALDADTGAKIWHHQTKAGDIWNGSIPFQPDLDLDIPDSAQIYRLNNGLKVVAAGGKSGFLYVLDAATGQLVNSKQFEPSSPFTGLFADTAQANGVTYINGTDRPQYPGGPGDGDIFAVRSDRPGNLHTLWSVHTEGSPNLGGVAVANGVVYVISSTSGKLYVIRASNGQVLKQIDVGVAINGPSVSHGRVFVGTGDIAGSAAPDGQPADGAIIAYGLP